MGYILVVVVLGVMILIHEAGHFVAARVVGIPVAQFAIGFGPRLWGFVRGRTEFRIGMIPLGGYVLPRIRDEQDYFRLALWRRLAFSLSGPAANVLVVVPLFALANALAGRTSLGELTLLPLEQTGRLLGQILSGLLAVFAHHDRLSSVLGIVTEGGQFIGLSLVRLTRFSILISLNLAIFNLLPLPPLDGGKIVLDVLHRLQPRLARLYVPLCALGWLLLIGLFLYATMLDVGRMFA